MGNKKYSRRTLVRRRNTDLRNQSLKINPPTKGKAKSIAEQNHEVILKLEAKLGK